MTRVKGGTISRARHKKVMKQAKGYFGSKHRLYRTAHEQVMHSGKYAFRDRRQKKRDFRKLWITRINAACRQNDISYSKFINGLTKADIVINRKMLSEIAIDNPAAFTEFKMIHHLVIYYLGYTFLELIDYFTYISILFRLPFYSIQCLFSQMIYKFSIFVIINLIIVKQGRNYL